MIPIRSTLLVLSASAVLAQATGQDDIKVQPVLPYQDPELKLEHWVAPAKPGSTPSDNLFMNEAERAAHDAALGQTSTASQSSTTDKGAPSDPTLPGSQIERSRGTHDHFQLDDPGDGSLWAFGGSFKASFDENGATYVPFLGSSAPRNFPVNISLESITLAGEELLFDAGAAPVFQGEAAVFDRGTVRERYELGLRHFEQLFVFDALPGAGEMVVTMAVDTELTPSATAEYLEYSNELGSVRYGMATVLDAAGDSAPAPTRLTDGGIEIRVPASFVQGATLPLTIDPVISTFIINDDATDDDTVPDVAYDINTNRFAVCWQRVFSSSDRDVWCEMRGSTGTLVASSGAYIDFTSSDWTNPNIANNRIADQFLVVAERGVYPTTDIYGRTREAENTTMGSQFIISTGSGDKRNPDVGGDPHTAGPTYYCVAWERAFDIAVDHDIHARLVRSSGTLLGSGAILIDNSSATYDKYPAVSNSDGVPSAATQEWNIVWQRQFNSTDWDIRGAQIHWSGTVTEGSFSVDFSSRDDWFPQASSPLDFQGNGPRQWMAVYRRNNTATGNFDIEATVWNGASYVGDENLSALIGTAVDQDQFEPTIDSNGLHFAVAWSELFGSSTVDRDVYIASFYMSGNDFHISESRTNLAFSVDPEYQVQMCARQSGGLTSDWSMVVWRDGDFGDGDLEGAVYEQPDFYGVKIGQNYCGPATTNSSGGRAEIHANGSAVAGGEPLNLLCYDMPINVFGLMNGGPNGTAFFMPPGSQGFFCISTPYGRMHTSPVLFSGSNGSFDLDVDTNDMPLTPHVPVVAGETWRFQAWFRDGASSNFTDGTAVLFH